ncbi:hypothetical protein K402DRAFT_417956 [Aulographum hederae CBS 113979]|uniref:Uncharacterized protein n=1 Tax=Aulographum hederae CBS 113979 TaxID=1176131 RepID=A0A6G1HBY5_9PEZI|nr:hypothetical protein K402DRAFT_417956 [Aulographum hederae CBS 113979]
MPPPRLRVTSSALKRCHQCQFQPQPARLFTTSTHRRAVGPESPRFLDIPQPPQTTARPTKRIRGFLPPPRNIFPDGAKGKLDTVALAARTPKSRTRAQPRGEEVGRIAWKHRMAERRRRNLQEGYTELHRRAQKTVQDHFQRSNKIQAKNRALASASERQDEKLTNVTVPRALIEILLKKGLPERTRGGSARKYQQKMEAKADQRRDQLHTLYLLARSFITDKSELSAAVEEAFGTETHPKVSRTMFDEQGVPHETQQLLKVERAKDRAQRRIKRIAEALTGGKIPMKIEQRLDKKEMMLDPDTHLMSKYSPGSG